MQYKRNTKRRLRLFSLGKSILNNIEMLRKKYGKVASQNGFDDLKLSPKIFHLAGKIGTFVLTYSHGCHYAII